MARTVADCALMLEAIAGEDGLDPRQIGVRTQPYVQALDGGADGLTVGVLREGFGIPDASEPDVDSAVREAAGVLERAGAVVEEISVPMHLDGLAIWNRSLWRARPTSWSAATPSAPTTRATTRQTSSTSTAAPDASAPTSTRSR
jgi:Asp-tRNA(Asn)/Glu-tRNA(Gln) amidotransferase A subunit family amidase